MSATRFKKNYTATGAKEWVPLDIKQPVFNVAYHGEITGTAIYQIETTMDDVTDPNESPVVTGTPLASGSVTAGGVTVQPARAIRVNITAISGSVTFRIVQAGL